jgi:hypothetical protein
MHGCRLARSTCIMLLSPKSKHLHSLGREKVSRSEMSARLRNACRFRFVGWVLDSFARDSLHLR